MANMQDPALQQQIAAAGWRVVDGLTDAAVAIADCRAGAEQWDWRDSGFPGPILAIVDSRNDRHSAERALQAGATHFHDLAGAPELLAAALQSALLYGRRNNADANGDGGTNLPALGDLFHDSAARRWIDERLEAGTGVGVILLALRNLGTINAAYGRQTGDRLLQLSCQRLLDDRAERQPAEHIVARLEGQHLLLAQSHVGAGDALAALAATLVQRLNAPLDLAGKRIDPAFCAGLARSNRRDDAAGLLRRADMVLLEALGGNSATIVDSDAVSDRLAVVGQLESDLQQALDSDQFAIVFQPQFRCDNGQLVGAEALSRWHHPEFGDIGGATLFAVAERAGLIRQLSARIQGMALGLAAAWPDSLSTLRLSLNVTAHDLAAPQFVLRFLDMVGESGFAPARLTIELIESHLLADMREATARLTEIRANGIRIAIDDFGTGYSSLSYLQKLPLDYLKVDSSFTKELDGAAKDRIVIDSIIRLAHSLSLEIVAEGVETQAQLDALKGEGTHYFQGFLRAGPMEPDEFVDFALRVD